MKFDQIPPIRGNPVIAKEIRSAAGKPNRKGRKRYRVNFICNNREGLAELSRKLGMSRAAVLNLLISTAQRKYCQ